MLPLLLPLGSRLQSEPFSHPHPSRFHLQTVHDIVIISLEQTKLSTRSPPPSPSYPRTPHLPPRHPSYWTLTARSSQRCRPCPSLHVEENERVLSQSPVHTISLLFSLLHPRCFHAASSGPSVPLRLAQDTCPSLITSSCRVTATTPEATEAAVSSGVCASLLSHVDMFALTTRAGTEGRSAAKCVSAGRRSQSSRPPDSATDICKFR